jgi:hypothetical protein
MSNHYPVLAALAAGLTINVVDVGSTLLFAAKPWEKELRRQGLEPRAATPPYYVLTNFVGGLLLAYVSLRFASSLGNTVSTTLKASLVMWLTTRIYGGGHVVMGQMPPRIFAVMSTGLCAGYLLAGFVFRSLAF